MREIRRLLGSAVMVFHLFSGQADAAEEIAYHQIAWGSPSTISADADVTTLGTLFGAINNGGAGVEGAFVNGVPFTPFATTGSAASVTVGNFTISGAAASPSGFTNEQAPTSAPATSTNYRTLLASSSFISGGSGLTVKISGLTVGQRYLVQAWANDSRGGAGTPRVMPLTGSPSVGLKVNDTGSSGGRGQFAIGTNTATAPATVFSVGPSSNEYGPFSLLSALQVRALPAAPPPELSNRGFYRGTLPGSAGGSILLFVHGNHSVSAYVASHQKFSCGGGTITPDGEFTFPMTLAGTSITGRVTAEAIHGSYTPAGSATESFSAERIPTSGPTSAIAGKYEGHVDGMGKLTVLIDPQGQLTIGGVNQNGATVGGGGTVNITTGETPSLANRAADWVPNDREDAALPKFTGTFKGSPSGYENEIVNGSFNFHRDVIEGVIGGKFRGTRQSSPNHLANISTRGTVTSGPRGQVIGGIIIRGGPKLVLIRAVGPSLVSAGVPDALSDPQLQLYSGETLLRENDDWQSNSNSAEITSTSIAPQHQKEAALLTRLEPGSYTAVVSGSNETTGVALVEVYEIIRD